MKGLHIIGFKAENFKRLSAVEIIPDGNTVIIAGKNGQGKSSVLDAIWHALKGPAAAKECGTTRPIRDGEDEAVVRLDLGEIIVTRRWKRSGRNLLEIVGADGTKFTSQQTLLDSLVGPISFDPLSFARMQPREQRRQLIGLLKLSVDPDELDAKKKQLYDERTIVNREVKAVEAELSSIPVPAQSTPDEEISISDVLGEIRAAQEAQNAYNAMQQRLVGMRERAVQLKAQIAKLTEELNTVVAEGKKLAAGVSAASVPDITELQTKMENIEKINAGVRVKRRRAELAARAADKRGESEALTARMEELEREKEAAFKAAKFPIDGLAFDDEGITYGGIPFRQCSSAEQMRVCIAIAAALNPTIRVIRLPDASLLDSDSLAAVSRFAEENDMQVWLECVSDGEPGIGIIIEDGMVKE